MEGGKRKSKESGRGFRLRIIRPQDASKVCAFLNKFFFRDEPLNVAVQLLPDANSTCPELEEYCLSCIPQGFSVMAISETNEDVVIGVCLNAALGREDEQVSEQPMDPKFAKIVNVLEELSKRCDIFEIFPDIDCAIDVKIVSVDDSYRGLGICKALIDKSAEIAELHGIPMMKVDCTSHYSAKAVAKLGFQCIYEMKYSEYVDEQTGEPVFKTRSPHESAKTFVLRLK